MGLPEDIARIPALVTAVAILEIPVDLITIAIIIPGHLQGPVTAVAVVVPHTQVAVDLLLPTQAVADLLHPLQALVDQDLLVEDRPDHQAVEVAVKTFKI